MPVLGAGDRPVAPVAVAEEHHAMQAAAARHFLFLFTFPLHPAASCAAQGGAAHRGGRPGSLDLAAVGDLLRERGGQAAAGFHHRPGALASRSTPSASSSCRAPIPWAWPSTCGATWASAAGAAYDKEEALFEFIREQVHWPPREDAVYGQRVSGFPSSLRQLARKLDAVRGRKQVILLSAGFDETPLICATGDRHQERRAVRRAAVGLCAARAASGTPRSRSDGCDGEEFASSDAVFTRWTWSGLLAGGDASQGSRGCVRSPAASP